MRFRLKIPQNGVSKTENIHTAVNAEVCICAHKLKEIVWTLPQTVTILDILRKLSFKRNILYKTLYFQAVHLF